MAQTHEQHERPDRRSGFFRPERCDLCEALGDELGEELISLLEGDPRAFARTLIRLRTTLEEHVRDEEGPGGLFELALVRSRRNERSVQRLHDEHREVLEIVEQLTHQATHHSGPRTKCLLDRLAALLRRHGAAERALLSDAIAG